MCSLYSINNSSKFAGQSSFQVVLCAKGSDNNTNSNINSNNNNSHNHHSSPSSPSAWSTSCSHSKRKKMKGAAISGSNSPVLVLSSQDDIAQPSVFHPPSFQTSGNRVSNPSSPHYPPLAHSPPAQAYQQPFHQRRPRHGHVSHSATHWQQFHQHHQYHDSYNASFEHGHSLELDNVQVQAFSRQKRASSSSNDQQSFASYSVSGNRRSSQILNSTKSIQVHSKSFSQPCSPSQSTPNLPSHCNPSLLSAQRKLACATATFSRPIDTAAVSFAAAVASAGTSQSMSAPALSTLFHSKDVDVSCEPSTFSTTNASGTAVDQANGAENSLLPSLHGDDAINGGSRAALRRSQSAGAVNDPSSPMGTSVDSMANATFDGDDMDLNHSTDSVDVTDSDSSMADAEARTRPLIAHLHLRSEVDSESKLQRKSDLKRKVDRLRTKNAALKSTVAQVKSDLALERQKRSTMDQIYLNIKKELNQKLESEEIKVLNLKAEMEQMAAEMKDLKDRIASATISAEAGRDTSSLRYKIGYDSSTYSLSSGIANIGGLMLGHHANLSQIGDQDDSEFLRSHTRSLFGIQDLRRSSAGFSSPSLAYSDSDEDELRDEDMEDDGQSDEDEPSNVTSTLINQTPPSVTTSPSRRGSVSSSNTLPTLTEEGSEIVEDFGEDSTDDDCSENEDDKAPCTMMEIILQRERTRSPVDDAEDPPADADETFETMAQKALFQAIRSRFTVAQAQLQLEELVLKYDANLEQAVDVIAKEVSRWWEDERVALGGPVTGGWGNEDVLVNKETSERANPKAIVEGRVKSFFGPLLLQFVASLPEQKMLLEKLGMYAKVDARWMRNHNAVLVALYKYDVVEGEAVLEWWQALAEPEGVFGHGGNNLRSLNSKFVAWLEDEEDDSESDDEESDSDSCCSDDDDDDSDENLEGEDLDDIGRDEEREIEEILDFAFPSNSNKDRCLLNSPLSHAIEGGETWSVESKKRISFCTNNLYYSQDGKVCRKKDATDDRSDAEGGAKKRYVQCPPLRVTSGEDEE